MRAGDDILVVTGGGGCIGREIAHEQAKHGYRVAVWDHDLRLASRTTREVEECGSRAIALAADVGDPDQVGRSHSGVAFRVRDGDAPPRGAVCR